MRVQRTQHCCLRLRSVGCPGRDLGIYATSRGNSWWDLGICGVQGFLLCEGVSGGCGEQGVLQDGGFWGIVPPLKTSWEYFSPGNTSPPILLLRRTRGGPMHVVCRRSPLLSPAQKGNGADYIRNNLHKLRFNIHVKYGNSFMCGKLI